MIPNMVAIESSSPEIPELFETNFFLTNQSPTATANTPSQQNLEELKAPTKEMLEPPRLGHSGSNVIGVLKPLTDTVSTDSRTMTVLPRLSVISSNWTGKNTTGSPPKVWQFEKSPNKRRMTADNTIGMLHAFQQSPVSDRKFSQKSSDNMRTIRDGALNQVYDFLNYEESSSESGSEENKEKIKGVSERKLEKVEEKQNTNANTGSPEPNTIKRSRASSINEFREKQMFFDLINMGKAKDIPKIESFLKNDPSQFIYEFGDPLSLVNKPNQIGQRPLYIAVKNGSLEIVKLLVRFHADPKLKSKITLSDGSFVHDSVLDAAARWNNIQILEYLLEKFEWTKQEKEAAASHSQSPSVKAMLLYQSKSPQANSMKLLRNSFVESRSQNGIELNQNEEEKQEKGASGSRKKKRGTASCGSGFFLNCFSFNKTKKHQNK